MSDVLDAAVAFDASWGWLLLIPAAAWFSWFAYDKTRPPVPDSTRTILTITRAVVLVLLLALLAGPVFNYMARRALRPVVAVLLDASLSMGVDEDGSTRMEQLLAAFADGLGETLPGPVLAFSTQAWDVDADTLARIQPTGQATDLSQALLAAEQAVADPRLLSGVVLLSDGRHNLGDDPSRTAAHYPRPIHTLLVGASGPPDDIQLVDVAPAGEPFAGRPVQLALRVRQSGFTGTPVSVQVLAGDELIFTHDVVLGEAGIVQTSTLAVPLSAGSHLLRVVLATPGGELTTHNNEALVSVDVRQERLQVLLLADRPSADLAFARRVLAADSTMRVAAAVGKSRNQVYDTDAGVPLQTADVLVVIGSLPPTVPVSALRQRVRDGAGLLWQTGADVVDADVLEMLPGQGTRAAGGPQTVRLSPSQGHALQRALRVTAGSTDPWARLPPLPLVSARLQPAPGAVSILSNATGFPVVLASATESGRIVEIAGRGFWRQDLFARTSLGDARTVPHLWSSVVHWLGADEPSGRIRATTDRSIYRSGQPVAVEVQAFDELSQPLDDVDIELRLIPGDVVVARPDGQGTYRAEFTGLGAGAYRFEVTTPALAGKESAGGTFVIEDHAVEFGDMRTDPQAMVEIARRSGGRAHRLIDWRDLLPHLQPAPTLVQEEQRLAIDIRHVVWLVAIVMLLTLEWVLRRRMGLL